MPLLARGVAVGGRTRTPASPARGGGGGRGTDPTRSRTNPRISKLQSAVHNVAPRHSTKSTSSRQSVQQRPQHRSTRGMPAVTKLTCPIVRPHGVTRAWSSTMHTRLTYAQRQPGGSCAQAPPLVHMARNSTVAARVHEWSPDAGWRLRRYILRRHGLSGCCGGRDVGLGFFGLLVLDVFRPVGRIKVSASAAAVRRGRLPCHRHAGKKLR